MTVASSLKQCKVDLHTHSIASPDGGITAADYLKSLENGLLDYIAITDHNTTDFAIQLKNELGTLGARIIIGEEIRTTHGEIIGLYLTKSVPKMLSPLQTVAAIRDQGGLVCIPHPFENVRRGIAKDALDDIAGQVDMIEVHNGRAVFQNKSQQAYAWASKHGCAGVASSDSHTASGLGRTYSIIASPPSREHLTGLMSNARYIVGSPGFKAVIAPKINKWKARYKRYV